MSESFRIASILGAEASQQVYPFTDDESSLLEQYFNLVIRWNAAIHLTTIVDPREFVLRNLLEPAFALRFLDQGIQEIWDLGSGSGVPGIPLAVLRPDLRVSLVEANRKRSIFLAEAIAGMGLKNVTVIRGRFEDLQPAQAGACVTSRAIEGFPRLLPGILGFASDARQLILFGNRALADEIEGAGWRVEAVAFPPGSERLVISVFHVER